eukprot:scaffold30331_cov35-Tisochrysis_lutea.AAC.5
MARGRLADARRRTSKKSWSCASPCCWPAIEKDWQGKPPQSRSCSGMAWSGISLISPAGHSPPKFLAYVAMAHSSTSDAKTHVPPRDSSAKRKPPIPAKSSQKVNLKPPSKGLLALVAPIGSGCRSVDPTGVVRSRAARAPRRKPGLQRTCPARMSSCSSTGTDPPPGAAGSEWLSNNSLREPSSTPNSRFRAAAVAGSTATAISPRSPHGPILTLFFLPLTPSRARTTRCTWYGRQSSPPTGMPLGQRLSSIISVAVRRPPTGEEERETEEAEVRDGEESERGARARKRERPRPREGREGDPAGGEQHATRAGRERGEGNK